MTPHEANGYVALTSVIALAKQLIQSGHLNEEGFLGELHQSEREARDFGQPVEAEALREFAMIFKHLIR